METKNPQFSLQCLISHKDSFMKEKEDIPTHHRSRYPLTERAVERKSVADGLMICFFTHFILLNFVTFYSTR
jgi:hypothetical protein